MALSTPWSWGYCSYDNPYYTEPIVVENTTIDYSQPITYGAGYSDTSAETLPAVSASNELLDAARQSFIDGDYPGALKLVDQAIAKQPGDLVAHEFRSLICFASKQYKEAAAAAYAVLSAGPGWDWTTQAGFYPDIDVYTQQLRALEQYVSDNPDANDARFVLAYQYLTCGYNDAAAKQLKAVLARNPKDQLATQLVASLTQSDAPQAATSAVPAKPATPVDAASLVGDWNVKQADGDTISLSLTGDSKYTWKYTHKGKTEAHQGSYTVADNLLILKDGDTPAMVGQVTLTGNGFNFKLANNNPNDPGLTFTK